MNANDFNVGDTVWYVEDIWENVEAHKSTVAFKTDKWVVLQSKDGYCYNIDVKLDAKDFGLFVFADEVKALKQAKLLIEQSLKRLLGDLKDYMQDQKGEEKNFVKKIADIQKKIDGLTKKIGKKPTKKISKLALAKQDINRIRYGKVGIGGGH